MAAIPPAMAPSTANWHWKNKNVTPWAKQWFERELTTVNVKGDAGEEAAISEVVSVDGDVELGQRKSKYVLSDSRNAMRLITYAHPRLDC